MQHDSLKHSPLIEALFELKWRTGNPPPIQQIGINAIGFFDPDPDYQIFIGMFASKIREQYPFTEALPASQTPVGVLPHVVQYRFRHDVNSWPLVQLGPGVLTVNDTEKYGWEDFKPRCEKSIKILFETHPKKDEVKIFDITLRYINAIKHDFLKEDVISFLKNKMKIEIAFPEQLFSDADIQKKPGGFNWQIAFEHKKLGLVSLRLSIGIRDNEPALFMETLIQSMETWNKGSMPPIPRDPNAISQWLEDAHHVGKEWFFSLIDGELCRRFNDE